METEVPRSSGGIAAFAVNDLVGVIHNQSSGRQPLPLNLALSRDGGMTWGAWQQVDRVRGELSNPSFVAGSDGRIHGVYTCNRRRIKHISFPIQMLGTDQ